MSVPRVLTATIAATAVATTGIAAAAEAPVVSKQHSIVGAAPITVPGTGVKKGDYMGARGVAVYRDVTLTRGQRIRLALRAPNGRRIVGLAVPDSQKVGFTIETDDYVGRRRVVLRAFGIRGAGSDRVSGRIYALTR